MCAIPEQPLVIHEEMLYQLSSTCVYQRPYCSESVMLYLYRVQTGDVSDNEQQSEPETILPTTKEAFVSTEQATGDNKTQEHVYDGYELLLDIDESVLDDHLPPPAGQCCGVFIAYF